MGKALGVQIKDLAMNPEAVDSIKIAVGKHAAVIEPKLDGHRLLAVRDEGGVRMYVARSGNERTGKLPEVEKVLARVLPPGTVLDGEAVGSSWGAVQSGLTSGGAATGLIYAPFDLLSHGGIDARPTPFGFRRKMLERALERVGDAPVQLVPQYDATQEAYEDLVKAGFEGAVVKHLDARYRSGVKGFGQFKLKHVETVDALVLGHEQGKAHGVLLFGRSDGSEWGRAKLQEPWDSDWIGRVVEVKHFGVMPSGALRHPQVLRIRLDKVEV